MPAPRTFRLGVDFGTTHTVGAVENPDGTVTLLLFDASPLLLSGVYAEADGRLSTGLDAVRGALRDPSRFEPNPKLRVDEGTVLLGDTEFDVAELIAAPLRRVSVEADRQLGAPVAQTVLTHPASWSGRRREILVRAAELAGLGGLTLVPEPVAAATFHARALAQPVPPGSALLVYDLGGGTFDATIVRRTGTGWEIVASAGLDDIGGTDLDAAALDQLGATVGAGDPRRWRRLISPTDQAGQRVLRAFRDDVRGAKEQLSRAPSTIVRVPSFEVEAYLSREEFEAAALPLLTRTVELVAQLLDRAGLPPSRLAGLFLVGGSSRIPLVATLLHRRFGIAPTLVEQPESVVVLGTLYVPRSAASSDPTGDTAGTYAWSPYPAEQAPTEQPADHESAAHQTGVHEPAPGGAAGHGPEQRTAPVHRPRRRRPGRTIAVLAVLLLLAFCGWQAVNRVVHNTASGAGRNGATTQSSGVAGKGAAARSVTVDKTAWYGGYRVAFGKATYDTTARYPLSIAVRVQNLGRTDRGLRESELPIFVNLDGRTTAGQYPSPLITIGSTSTVDATVTFELAQPVTDLNAGVLTLGANDDLPATVPIGAAGTLVALEPVTVLADTALTVQALRFNHLSCELRGDDVVEHDQVTKGNMAIGCTFDVTYTGKEFNIGIFAENVRLVMPDGDLRAPTRAPSALVGKDEQVRGISAVFVVPWPTSGKFALRLLDLDRYAASDVHGRADVPLTMP